MATWKKVCELLGTKVEGLGGGPVGILLKHPTREEWFQVCDIPGTVSFTVDDSDGNNVYNHIGNQALEDWGSDDLADVIYGWAKGYGYTLKNPAAGTRR